MASIISAGNATNGLGISSDNTGIMTVKTGTGAGTTALTLDASQNLQFNSGYGSAATAYGCRAWVNFNGTGTVAIRASGNVSSITDNGTGDYTVNFATAMSDANYATSITVNRGNTNTTLINISRLADELSAPTTVAVRVVTGVPDGLRALQKEDSSYVNVSIFR